MDFPKLRITSDGPLGHRAKVTLDGEPIPARRVVVDMGMGQINRVLIDMHAEVEIDVEARVEVSDTQDDGPEEGDD